jgi:hypothetical protein
MLGLAGADELAGGSDSVDPCYRKGGNGKGNGRSAGRRPRRIRGCGDCPARMEWRVARARLVEEEPGFFIQSGRQVLEREPSGVPEWAIQQSPPVGTDEVVSSGHGQARSEDDPCMGGGQRDPCTNSRPHSRRRGASVQRRQRALVAVARVHDRPGARSRQQVALGCGRESVSTTRRYRCPGMYDRSYGSSSTAGPDAGRRRGAPIPVDVPLTTRCRVTGAMATVDYAPTPAVLSDLTSAEVPFWAGRDGDVAVVLARHSVCGVDACQREPQRRSDSWRAGWLALDAARDREHLRREGTLRSPV